MKILKMLITNLIISFVLSAVFIVLLIEMGVFDGKLFNIITKEILSREEAILKFFLKIGIFNFIWINLARLPIYMVEIISFAKDIINKKYIDTKESVYTRYLPKYNSAVAGEIVDFKSTFEEEYLAGIIELISKGYIIENEDRLIVDESKSQEGLLMNEKYILKTCTNINSNLFANISYEFYEELKKDMYELGLYKKDIFSNDLKNKDTNYTKKETAKIKIFLITIIVVLSIVLLMMGDSILLILLYSIIILIAFRKNKLTPEGELEKERMGKLKLFLEKEIEFQDKGEEERKLWERYSAFAVAFGLNSKMAENVRSKIIKENNKLKI